MTPQAVTALAGGLRVWPGVARPHNLQDRRVDLAALLAPGRPVDAWPSLVGGLFNLCGHAQRLCATLAVAAAAPDQMAPPIRIAEQLRTETAQEHVRRIGLDWPRLLGRPDAAEATATAAAAALRRCPLLLPRSETRSTPWAPMANWLAQELLQMAPRTWWLAWRADGSDWLRHWSQHHAGWLPALVREALAWDGDTVVDPASAVCVPADLARATAWSGAHTGSWTRQSAQPLPTPLTPWGLLGSRLAELVALCLDGGPGRGPATLAWGALPTAPGEGLAWVEMARGLLLHEVTVDGDSGRVRASRLRAPTDWNFHPEGEVARHLAALDAREHPDRLVRRVGLLMVAFDPCVPFEIACRPATPAEAWHA
jgi:hypothetical protein